MSKCKVKYKSGVFVKASWFGASTGYDLFTKLRQKYNYADITKKDNWCKDINYLIQSIFYSDIYTIGMLCGEDVTRFDNIEYLPDNIFFVCTNGTYVVPVIPRTGKLFDKINLNDLFLNGAKSRYSNEYHYKNLKNTDCEILEYFIINDENTSIFEQALLDEKDRKLFMELNTFNKFINKESIEKLNMDFYNEYASTILNSDEMDQFSMIIEHCDVENYEQETLLNNCIFNGSYHLSKIKLNIPKENIITEFIQRINIYDNKETNNFIKVNYLLHNFVKFKEVGYTHSVIIDAVEEETFISETEAIIPILINTKKTWLNDWRS